MVHSVTTATWHGADAPVAADLSPGRPFRGDTWCQLLDDGGYDASVQYGPDEADFLVTAVRRAAPGPTR